MKIRKEYLPRELNLQLFEPYLNDLEKKMNFYYQLYGARLKYSHEIEYDTFEDFYAAIKGQGVSPKEVGISVFFHKKEDKTGSYVISLFIDINKNRIVLSTEGSKEYVTLIENNFKSVFNLEDKLDQQVEGKTANPEIIKTENKENKANKGNFFTMDNPIIY